MTVEEDVEQAFKNIEECIAIGNKIIETCDEIDQEVWDQIMADMDEAHANIHKYLETPNIIRQLQDKQIPR